MPLPRCAKRNLISHDPSKSLAFFHDGLDWVDGDRHVGCVGVDALIEDSARRQDVNSSLDGSVECVDDGLFVWRCPCYALEDQLIYKIMRLWIFFLFDSIEQ